MITKAGVHDAQMLATLGAQSFRESHAASAASSVIDTYTGEKYNQVFLAKELANPNAIFHLISHHNQPAGYSKMLLRQPCLSGTEQHLSKLEQLYLLSAFKGLHLGAQLMTLNIELSKLAGQNGIWLEVWTGNSGAISFYQQFGFAIIDEGTFKLTPEHYNPHYVMLLLY